MTAAPARPRLRLSILPILAAALGLRLAFGLYLGERIYQPDEGVYVTLARNLAATGVLGSGGVPTADRPPLLPALLAGVFVLTGAKLLAARALFAVLGTLTVWVVYRYALLLFGPEAALYSALAAAVHPFLIYWSGILMTETPAVLLVLAAAWGSQALLEAPPPPLGGASRAGACWGLATLTRTQNLVFGPLVAALALRRRPGRAAAAAVFLASALAFPAAWALRNKVELGSAALDTHAGYTLVIRTMFYDQDNVDTGVANAALQKTDLYRRAMALAPARRDAYFARAAFAFIREHPLTYLRHCAGNFVQLWRFYPRLDKTVGVTTEFLGRDRRLFAAVSLLSEPAVILLGLAGFFFAFREGLPVQLPALFIAVTTAIHVAVIPQMRYRLPMEGFVILLAGFGLARLLGRPRGRPA
ncbi:MAG TPA: glycosyltransferase family 39 protein [Elusimicrobiota bacterium]|nr:glycosyltransferase family 39 protein [Elusimicrobiota bacterium]